MNNSLKKLLLLRSALNVESQDYRQFDREDQYLRGIESVKKFGFLSEFDEIWLVDNTCSRKQTPSHEVLNAIPVDWKIKLPETNKYGIVNKGAGDIETLVEMKGEINQFDYVFFHELRLWLHDDSLVRKFLETPGEYLIRESKYFRNWRTLFPSQSIASGHYGCSAKFLLNFLESSQPALMVQENLSIEELLYKFALVNGIKPLMPKSFTMRYLAEQRRYRRY